jgi:hypothetical protein
MKYILIFIYLLSFAKLANATTKKYVYSCAVQQFENGDAKTIAMKRITLVQKSSKSITVHQDQEGKLSVYIQIPEVFSAQKKREISNAEHNDILLSINTGQNNITSSTTFKFGQQGRLRMANYYVDCSANLPK